MNYIYFIVYKGCKNGCFTSEGNTEMICSKLIDSIEDIRRLERLIVADSKVDGLDLDAIVITWYNLLQTKSFKQ